nr:amino acid permease [Klebsiella pneumoniae subsp. pneumoniae]
MFLAFAMLLLTRIRPDLDGGIFTYAREGFGELIGFAPPGILAVRGDRQRLLSGYRLFGAQFFTDTPELRLFGDGNTWQSIVGASVLLWIVHFLVLRGVQTAAGINLVATLAKLLPLGAFVALAALAFQLDTFRLDFSGLALGVPVWEQVKNTMLITLWVFIGVEGR